MRTGVILDTGPLVAMLDRRDRYHGWVKEQLVNIAAPMVTCESVVSEAVFLVQDLAGGTKAVLDLLRRGIISVDFHLDAEMESVARLMARFASVPMALADACLVRMAEQRSAGVVFTLDSDFGIYRKNGRQIVPTIMPERR